jgi:hypothetical protein
MTGTAGQSPEWAQQQGGVWTRTLPVKVGEPDLILRVSPNQHAYGRDDLWTWEIVDLCDEDQFTEGEIDNGEAGSCEAAMEAALAEALAHIARMADE